MPVLKQYDTTPAMRNAIVLDLGDIGAQATRIRAAAETQAQDIIAKAEAKSEEIARQRGDAAQEQGYNDGLERGLAEGREQGRAEALAEASAQLQQLVAAWSQVANDWEQQRTEMEREARQSVIEFALCTAEKLVHRVIEVDESVVVDQASQALSAVLSAHDATVRVHPVDRPMLEDAVPQLVAELATLEHIDLVDDESITPGGCVVAFGQGRVDATIERQMQRLVDLILPAPEVVEDEAAQAAEPMVQPQTQPPAQRTAPPPDDSQTQSDAQSNGQASTPTFDASVQAPVYEITEEGLVSSDAAVTGLPNDLASDVPDAGVDEGIGDATEREADDESEA